MTDAAAQAMEKRRLHCMEIWGGNQAMDNAVSVPGMDAWIFSMPFAGHSVGGDLHYISLCGGNKIARFAVADVSGHGSEVGDLAATLRALMRKNINKVDQSRFIRSLNKGFTALARDGKFATALLTTYYAPTDHLITCNAGHPPPLWYRAGPGRWQLLDRHVPDALDSLANLPLGVISRTDYHQFAVKLERGDLVVVYTDGLWEAKSPVGRQLGGEGLLNLVRRLDSTRPEKLIGALLESVASYSGGAPIDDDVTVIVLHHNDADAPRQSLGEMIKVVGKMIGLIRI